MGIYHSVRVPRHRDDLAKDVLTVYAFTVQVHIRRPGPHGTDKLKKHFKYLALQVRRPWTPDPCFFKKGKQKKLKIVKTEIIVSVQKNANAKGIDVEDWSSTSLDFDAFLS